MKHLATLCLFLFSLVTVQAQLIPDWAFRREIALSNTSATNDFTGGPIHFVLNGETLKNDGKINNDFSDLRVSIDCDGDSILTHWIENPGNTTDSVVVWVRYPDTITVGNSVNVYAFYGNPAAPNVEDFNTIFPNRIVLSADSTITDTIVTDWFEVPDGITLTGATQAGVHAIIASRIKIDGQINLDGLGEVNDIAAPADGAGTGEDGFGGGGGGYGGNGGSGNDVNGLGTGPGAGGSAVGAPGTFDISFGFAGGNAFVGEGITGIAVASDPGASGGGAIAIKGQIVTVDSVLNRGLVGVSGEANPIITVTGNDPAQSGSGGGAGGGVLVEGSQVVITSRIDVSGGAGGDNPSSDEGAAGGGAGGRIKLFAPKIQVLGILSANGGNGGTAANGNAGTAGSQGSTNQAANTEHPATNYIFGPETPTTIDFLDAVAPNYQECRYDSIGYTVSGGFDSYEFFIRDVSVQNGPQTALGTDTLSFDAETYVLGTRGICLTSSDTLTLDILSRPFADFIPTGFNLTWEFENTSVDAVDFEWDFGDGLGTSTDKNPTYKFQQAGDYTVCLSAIDNALECPSFDTCKTITVECNPPRPAATFDQNGLFFEFFDFSDFAETISWDFGDGTTSTEQSPSHSYTDPGVYTVTLTVSNECGEDSFTFEVEANCEFKTEFTATQLGNSLTVEFVNTTPANRTSRWDFGDGVVTAGPDVTQHTFSTNGAYTVCLTSESKSCGATVSCELISVTCTRPSVDFTFSTVDTTVDFTANVVGNVGDVEWDFDDRDSVTTELNPTYTFSKQGEYNVCLSAENECGSTALCQRVEVECPDPEARFEFIRNGYQIAFGDSSANAVSWFWDFDDGTTSTEQHPIHIYPDDTTRTYFPCLTIRNSCNESDRVCKSFRLIKKPDPVGVADFSNADFRLFPNPVQEVLYVSTPVAIDTYRLVSYNGAVLETSKDFKDNAIDVSNLSSGSYILELSTESGQLIRKRFVKY